MKELHGQKKRELYPGAGTGGNSVTYEYLKRHYDVQLFNTTTRNGGFKYPKGWTDIGSVSLNRHKSDSLMGLANEIGKHIINNPPSMIICGSRGSQVVLPILLQYFWRGAFIAINGGLLTSKTHIPKDISPILVTCGKDYFKTKDPSWTLKQFQDLSKSEGLDIHFKDEAHMPNLPQKFLKSICDFILKGHAIPYSTNYEVKPLKIKTTAAKSSTAKVTVNNKSHGSTLLRRNNTSDNVWYPDRRSIKNKVKVDVLSQDFDEKMYSMLFIKNKSTEGWIYAKNILELQ